jgi:hypothetical protein
MLGPTKLQQVYTCLNRLTQTDQSGQKNRRSENPVCSTKYICLPIFRSAAQTIRPRQTHVNFLMNQQASHQAGMTGESRLESAGYKGRGTRQWRDRALECTVNTVESLYYHIPSYRIQFASSIPLSPPPSQNCVKKSIHKEGQGRNRKRLHPRAARRAVIHSHPRLFLLVAFPIPSLLPSFNSI